MIFRNVHQLNNKPIIDHDHLVHLFVNLLGQLLMLVTAWYAVGTLNFIPVSFQLCVSGLNLKMSLRNNHEPSPPTYNRYNTINEQPVCCYNVTIAIPQIKAYVCNCVGIYIVKHRQGLARVGHLMAPKAPKRP